MHCMARGTTRDPGKGRRGVAAAGGGGGGGGQKKKNFFFFFLAPPPLSPSSLPSPPLHSRCSRHLQYSLHLPSVNKCISYVIVSWPVLRRLCFSERDLILLFTIFLFKQRTKLPRARYRAQPDPRALLSVEVLFFLFLKWFEALVYVTE